MRRAKKKKESKGQRVKPLTPTQVIDRLIGDEEQYGKPKKEEKEKQEAGSQPSYPGPFGRLL